MKKSTIKTGSIPANVGFSAGQGITNPNGIEGPNSSIVEGPTVRQRGSKDRFTGNAY